MSQSMEPITLTLSFDEEKTVVLPKAIVEAMGDVVGWARSVSRDTPPDEDGTCECGHCLLARSLKALDDSFDAFERGELEGFRIDDGAPKPEEEAS